MQVLIFFEGKFQHLDSPEYKHDKNPVPEIKLSTYRIYILKIWFKNLLEFKYRSYIKLGNTVETLYDMIGRVHKIWSCYKRMVIK